MAVSISKLGQPEYVSTISSCVISNNDTIRFALIAIMETDIAIILYSRNFDNDIIIIEGRCFKQVVSRFLDLQMYLKPERTNNRIPELVKEL